jgi:hypothetical protein
MPKTAFASGGGSLHDILRHILSETKKRPAAMIQEDHGIRSTTAAAAAAVLARVAPGVLLRGGRGRGQQESNKRQRTESTADVTDTARCKDHDLDSYRRQLVQLKEDAAAADDSAGIDAAAALGIRSSIQQMRDLSAVYLFGLEQVGALQDLRQAPDAILPGNFVVDVPVLLSSSLSSGVEEPASAATAGLQPVATATVTGTESAAAAAATATTETKTPAAAATATVLVAVDDSKK